jgi:hypothetical protein
MIVSLNPHRDLANDLAGIQAPLLVLVGDRDESFYPERFEPTISPHARGAFRVLPGVTHLGLVVTARTADEVGAWLATLR